MKNILITSGSGQIGRRLVPLLLSHSSTPKIVLPTSNASKLSSQIPSESSSRVTVTDKGRLDDPFFVQDLLTTHDVDTVFLNLTGNDELFVTNAFLSAISKSPSVKHLIYLSNAYDYFDPSAAPAYLGSGAHVTVKLAIEYMLRHLYPSSPDKFTWTVLGPTLFMDNNLRAQGSVMGDQGMFMEPFGPVGCSWIEVEDIALAAVKSMEDAGREWGGKKVMLGTKKKFSDQDMERLWSAALKRDIKVNRDIDVLEKAILPYLGPAWTRDLSQMFEVFQKHGFGITDEQYADQVRFLGKEPAAYEDYIKRLAEQWLAG